MSASAPQGGDKNYTAALHANEKIPNSTHS